jgi:Planctomycete cytochrome C
MRHRLTTLSVAVLLLVAAAATAAGKKEAAAEPDEPPTFARDVMPALGRYCENCHGDKEQHGGLRLDNYDNLMRGGDSGPVVIAGDVKKSVLVAKIEHRDRPSMPPRKWLPKAIIARIKAWVAAGAQP